MVRREMRGAGRVTSRRGRKGVRSGIRLADRSDRADYFLDTGILPGSTVCSGQRSEIPDNGVNTHLGNPG